MSVKDRLKQYIKKEGISISDFEKSISAANGYVNSISKSIGIDKLNETLEKYPKLNIEWLLTGKGYMYKGLKRPELMTEVEMEQHDQEVTEGKWQVASCQPKAILTEDSKQGIPLIPLNAMAGVASGEFQIMEYDCERYVVPMFRDAEYLIPVKGDSMQPKFLSGDVVACKNIPLNDLFFEWNRPYVIDTKLGAMIKRIRKGSDDEHVLIVSENPDYEPFELHKSQINAVAQVVGVIRLE